MHYNQTGKQDLTSDRTQMMLQQNKSGASLQGYIGNEAKMLMKTIFMKDRPRRAEVEAQRKNKESELEKDSSRTYKQVKR